jgi:hypothetical protein
VDTEAQQQLHHKLNHKNTEETTKEKQLKKCAALKITRARERERERDVNIQPVSYQRKENK